MTKRGFRDGGIDARGENSWRLRYRVDGTRYAKTFHGTKSEAQKELRRLLASADNGEHVAPDRIIGAMGRTLVSDRRARQTAKESRTPNARAL
jgi:hypothetical protein